MWILILEEEWISAITMHKIYFDRFFLLFFNTWKWIEWMNLDFLKAEEFLISSNQKITVLETERIKQNAKRKRSGKSGEITSV